MVAISYYQHRSELDVDTVAGPVTSLTVARCGILWSFTCPLCSLLEDCFRDAITLYRSRGWLDAFKLHFVRVKDTSGSIIELFVYTLRHRPGWGPYSKAYETPGPHYFQHFQLAADRGQSL